MADTICYYVLNLEKWRNINNQGRQLTNPGSPGKIAIKTECVVSIEFWVSYLNVIILYKYDFEIFSCMFKTDILCVDGNCVVHWFW